MRRSFAVAGVLLAVAFVAIQFVPVERSNALGAGDPEAPREVQWILRRACYDCHSGESRWPLWAYVAPISWQVVSDVERARSVLNFSDWQAYDYGRRVVLRKLIGPVTASHRMPLWYYATLHPDAWLDARTWRRSRSGRTTPARRRPANGPGRPDPTTLRAHERVWLCARRPRVPGRGPRRANAR